MDEYERQAYEELSKADGTSSSGPVKHYWWKYLLFVLLGWFLGIGSVAGAIAIAGYTIKGSQIEKWTGQDIFQPEYESKTIIDMITTIAKNPNELSTLGGIAKITPMVDKLVDELNKVLNDNLGFEYDKAELYKREFSQMGDYLLTALKDGTQVAKIIKAGPDSSDIIKLMLFHKNEDGSYDYTRGYTITDFSDPTFFDNRLAELKIRDVVKIGDNDTLLKAIADFGLDDFKDGGRIYTITIGEFLGNNMDENNSLLQAIKDWSIKDLQDFKKMESLTVGQLMGDADESNSFLNALKDKTVGDLKNGNFINELVIGELLGFIDTKQISSGEGAVTIVSHVKTDDGGEGGKDTYTVTFSNSETFVYKVSHGTAIKTTFSAGNKHWWLGNGQENNLMMAIAGWTVNQLKSKESIDSLTIADIFGDVDESNSVLYAIRSKTLGELTDADTLNNITIGELLGAVDTKVASEDGLVNITIVSHNKTADNVDGKDEYTITFSNAQTYVYTVAHGKAKFATFIGNGATWWIAENSLAGSIGGWTIADLKDGSKFDTIAIESLMGDIDTSGNPLLKTIIEKGWTIGTLKSGTAFDNITIGELTGETENPFLNAIASWTVSDLKDGNSIDSLVIGDIIGGNVNTMVPVKDEYDADITIVSNVRTAVGDPDDTYTVTFSNGATFSYTLAHTADPEPKVPFKKTVNEVTTWWLASNNLMSAVANWSIADMKNGSKINQLTLRQVLGDEKLAGSKILTALADEEIGNLSTAIQTKPLSTFLDVEGNKVLKLVENSTLQTLATDVNSITFAQLLDESVEDTNPSLYHYLSTYTIGTIDAAISEMTIGAVISEETGILGSLDKSTPISQIGTAIKNMKMMTAFEEQIFENYDGSDPAYDKGEDYMKGVWKFMLTPAGTRISLSTTKYKNEPTKAAMEAYTIGNNMNDLINNFTWHTQNETLDALSDAGLLDSSSVDLLTKKVGTVGYAALVSAGQGYGKSADTLYGQLTVKELLTVMNVAVGYIPVI